MSFLHSASILPLRSLTSASRFVTGSVIIMAGLGFTANNLLLFA